ncbi:MAG TPA: alpha/beta hydrolase [Acetobacteraceae bacterium]|nr:alpha/beta hydrolase [Acetobacteraceae bacterium]
MDRITLAGIDLALCQSGRGPPLLFLHGAGGFRPEDAFVSLLGKHRRVIAPSHPGFGESTLPDWMDRPDDIALLYLELLASLGEGPFDLIGCSLGGWIGAELASMVPERFRRIVFVAPVGVKLGGRDTLDIPDIFAMPAADVEKLLYHDPDRHRPDLAALSDAQLATMLRNRETTALLVWEPYMHNPKLRHRLHRITSPSLFLRGQSDGLVSADYLEGYARLLPNAGTTTIAAAGHVPQLEQSTAFAETVLAFLDGGN